MLISSAFAVATRAKRNREPPLLVPISRYGRRLDRGDHPEEPVDLRALLPGAELDAGEREGVGDVERIVDRGDTPHS
jgi:hypothetical protein